MNLPANPFADTLEPLGVAAGVFLVLAAIGTIVGAPWATYPAIAAAIQVLGAVLMGLLGAGLAYISWTGGD